MTDVPDADREAVARALDGRPGGDGLPFAAHFPPGEFAQRLADIAIAALRERGWGSVETSARLVESMIPERKNVGERVALAIAAKIIRRGRRLTWKEQAANLAKAMAEADAEAAPSPPGAEK